MLRQWHHQGSGRTWEGEDLTVLTRHEYDQADRLTHMYQTIDDEDEQLLAYYEYNELGQLVDKGLHEVAQNPNGPDTYCQSVDYRYTIRGWLASMNQNNLTEGGITGSDITAGADLFAQQFAYEDQITGLTGQQPQCQRQYRCGDLEQQCAERSESLCLYLRLGKSPDWGGSFCGQ